MSPEEFRAAAHQTVDWIADYLRDIREYPVLPDVEPGALIDRLPKSGPEQGEPMDAILRISASSSSPASRTGTIPASSATFPSPAPARASWAKCWPPR